MSTRFISKVNCWSFFKHILLPGTCILCHKPSYRQIDLCPACESTLPPIDKPCLCCGLPLETGEYQGRMCGRCITNPTPYSHIVSAFDYAEPSTQLISAFKYRAKLANGKVLSTLLLQKLHTFYAQGPLPELLIPMPLHKKRLRERGFNQAIEIARPLSRALKIPINRAMFCRQRNTEKQEGLKVKERQRNLRGAFACQDKEFRLPSCVAIIDDVVTTTASTTSLCRLLKKHGASDIHIWSLARACKKY